MPGSPISEFDDYLSSAGSKIEQLKKLVSELGDEVLQTHPEIFRNILNLLTLRIAADSEEEKQIASKFRESNRLTNYHSKLVETQLLITDKLCSSMKQGK